MGAVPAPYVWGHHPCFARSTFAGGRLHLDAAAAAVPVPVFDEANNSLAPGVAFEFPDAPTRSGGVRDVGYVPEHADGRHEQSTVMLRTGGVRITAPRFGRSFRLTWDVADMPFVLLWQDYLARDAAFWGTCDTFAVEPSSAPGRSLDDAVAAGSVRYLEPGATYSLEMRAAWLALSDADA